MVIVFLLILLMNPSQPKMLLGAGQEVTDKVTSLGIRYNDAGFSSDKPKKMKKTTAWLEKRGHRRDLINNFGNFALQLNDPQFIPNEIDKAFETIKNIWLSCSCGGKHRRIAESVDPHSIKIIIEPCPFWVEYHKTFAKAATMNQTTIRAAIICFYGSTEPAKADLTDFRRLIEWETGNLYAMRAGYQPKSVAEEVGNKNPCSIF